MVPGTDSCAEHVEKIVKRAMKIMRDILEIERVMQRGMWAQNARTGRERQRTGYMETILLLCGHQALMKI